MQDRANSEDDQIIMNCISCNNVSLKTIESDVNKSQECSDTRSQCFCNNEKTIVNIINLLIKISMLKKKKSKDLSWKKIVMKLMQHFQLESEEKHYMNQNAFIAKNV